jgi:hypothetical protein
LTHATLSVTEGKDDLFGRTLGDGSFRIAASNRSTGTSTAQARRFDTAIIQDSPYDRRDDDAGRGIGGSASYWRGRLR